MEKEITLLTTIEQAVLIHELFKCNENFKKAEIALKSILENLDNHSIKDLYAYYFLAVAYDKVNRRDEASAILKKLKKSEYKTACLENELKGLYDRIADYETTR